MPFADMISGVSGVLEPTELLAAEPAVLPNIRIGYPRVSTGGQNCPGYGRCAGPSARPAAGTRSCTPSGRGSPRSRGRALRWGSGGPSSKPARRRRSWPPSGRRSVVPLDVVVRAFVADGMVPAVLNGFACEDDVPGGLQAPARRKGTSTAADIGSRLRSSSTTPSQADGSVASGRRRCRGAHGFVQREVPARGRGPGGRGGQRAARRAAAGIGARDGVAHRGGEAGRGGAVPDGGAEDLAQHRQGAGHDRDTR